MSANQQSQGGRKAPPVQTTLVRLDADQFAKLAARFPPCVAGPNTSPIQAGELIGIQRVLNVLREGWVV